MGLQHVDLSYQREQVYAETWGCLAPKKNVTYKGWIIFSKSNFYSRNNPIVDFEFKGLGSSPWLFQKLEEYIFDLDLPKGVVYKMNITFRNYRIWTKLISKFE